MTLPLFSAQDSPGPSFVKLLDAMGLDPNERLVRAASLASPSFSSPSLAGSSDTRPSIPHATTIVAICYADGVVMAGDRRATAGLSIANRDIEKVFPADRHSGLSVSGTAGLCIELVRLYQTQLEHYEKVEGQALSLEGKANQLASIIRNNLTLALQGLAVVPILAGYDLNHNVGRIFTYDITGGRYEEQDHYATGSGGRDARTTIKLGYKRNMDRAAAVELAIQGLYEAADEDAGTGGPDVVRGIYPTVATITREGFVRIDEQEIASSFQALIARKSAEGHQP